MEEVWKQFDDSVYEISSKGRVRSVRNGEFYYLKPYLGDKGYYRIGLTIYGRRYNQTIHRMVAMCRQTSGV